MHKFQPELAFDFVSKTPQSIKWIWEPFIPEGSLSLCVAYMKVGKSTLIYHLIGAMAHQELFIGHKTTKVGTLILAVEEHPRDVAIRLQEESKITDGDDQIYVHSGPVIPNSEFFADLEKFIIEKKIGLCVVDTLSNFWVVLDENDNAEVKRGVLPLLGIARRTNCAVVMVHHANKGEGTGGRAIRGASSLFGIVDQALILHRHGDTDSVQRKLETFGRYKDSPREVVIGLGEEGYYLVGTAEDVKIDSLRESIKEFLEQFKSDLFTANDLAQMLKIPFKKVLKALNPVPDWCLRTGGGKKGDPYFYSWKNVSQSPQVTQLLNAVKNSA